MSPLRRPAAARFLPLLLVLFLLSACGQQSTKQFDPKKIDFTATVDPLFDGQLYPSLLLALNQGNPSSTSADAPSPIPAPLSVSLVSPANNAVLRIVIDSSAFNYVTILQDILPARGETYTLHPSVKWKYDRLRQNRRNQPLDLTLSCYINDEQVDIRNLHLTLRSVNECPLSFRLPQGQTTTTDAAGTQAAQATNGAVDTRWLFAAYVNEEHPQIPNITQEILEQGIVSRLQGYQTGKAADVRQQLLAVWHNTLLRGISYSSISCTSNPSSRANVQHIRFFDEVWNTRQANCIDACVYLASILRKTGLRPLIFVEPCHAYLGIYNTKRPSSSAITLIETTVTSWVNYPDLLRKTDAEGRIPPEELEKIAKYLSPKQLEAYQQGLTTTDQLLVQISTSLFDKATQYNRETYEANRKHFDDPNNTSFQKLDIELLRRQVQPIN